MSAVYPATGCQVPRLELVPPAAFSGGEEALELAAEASINLDPWERRVIRGSLGQNEIGHWAAAEVGLIVGRQNGKGTCIEVVSLDALFLRDLKVLYTAHLMSTARKLRERMQILMESSPDFDREIRQVRTSNEEQSILLKSGARIEFVTRTGSAARGWTLYDLIFFDEAFALTAEMVGAIMPIMFARQNWQLWYVSMGGMANSTALRNIRIRAINGDPELAYFEYSVDEAYHDAPEYVANMPAAWAQANPAAGIRISWQTIRKAQRTMDPAIFARECLCVWDDPGGMLLINPNLWARLIDYLSQIVSQVVFAADCSPGLMSGAIGVAGFRNDRIPHAEITSREGIIDHRAGVEWMIPRMKWLNDTHHPIAWLIDGSGPVRALLTDMRRIGIEPYLLNGREMGEACGSMLVAATSPAGDRVRHLGQECVLEAIKGAGKRDVVDAWVFSRRNSGADICPLMALTEALHGLAVFDVAMYDILESVR